MLMMQCYNHSTLIIEDKNADSLALKSPSSNVKIYQFTNGKVLINTDDFIPQQYNVQYFKGNDVVKQDILFVKQNLKFATQSFNPRSKARQILDAIQAFLAGKATNNQRRIKVGDKQLENSSFDELIKWKNYYQKQALKEEGKPTQIRHQKLFYHEPIGMWRR